MYCKHVAQNDKRLSAVLDPHLPRFGLSRAGYLGHRAGTRVDFWLGALCCLLYTSDAADEDSPV